MKVIAYIRKSTDDERIQTTSHKYQRAEIEERYSKEYSEIEYYEVSESAAKKGRKVFTEILKKIENYIKKGEQTVLLSHNIDRLTRNLYDLAKLDELRRAGLQIRTIGGDISGDSAMMTLSIQAIFATDFVDRLKSKMSSAYLQLAKEGKWTFGTITGYMKGKEKGIREPHPEKSKAIQQIFKEFLESDFGVSQFKKRVNEILTLYDMRKLSLNGLIYLLKNRYYIGKIEYKEKEY